MQEEFSKALARKMKAEIYFGDETGVRSDFLSGTTRGIKEKTPVVSSSGARFGLILISAVNPRGNMRFMVTRGRVGDKTFIQFLRRLFHNANQMIFLVVDRHPAHRAKAVARYADSVKDRLWMFYLPPYAPELNPDELVWNHLKNRGIGRQAITCKSHLKKTVLSYMRKLQKSPDLIRSFFYTQTTCYVA